MARVYPAVAAANIRAALQRVERWSDACAAGQKVAFPDERDLKLYQEARRMVRESDA